MEFNIFFITFKRIGINFDFVAIHTFFYNFTKTKQNVLETKKKLI